jgi:hypothetical protein
LLYCQLATWGVISGVGQTGIQSRGLKVLIVTKLVVRFLKDESGATATE